MHIAFPLKYCSWHLPRIDASVAPIAALGGEMTRTKRKGQNGRHVVVLLFLVIALRAIDGASALTSRSATTRPRSGARGRSFTVFGGLNARRQHGAIRERRGLQMQWQGRLPCAATYPRFMPSGGRSGTKLFYDEVLLIKCLIGGTAIFLAAPGKERLFVRRHCWGNCGLGERRLSPLRKTGPMHSGALSLTS